MLCTSTVSEYNGVLGNYYFPDEKSSHTSVDQMILQQLKTGVFVGPQLCHVVRRRREYGVVQNCAADSTASIFRFREFSVLLFNGVKIRMWKLVLLIHLRKRCFSRVAVGEHFLRDPVCGVKNRKLLAEKACWKFNGKSY